jgi:hypothetical protein
MSTIKRTLANVEQRMSMSRSTATPEQAAKAIRWNLSGNAPGQMPVSDLQQINRMYAGDFPATMTPADIAEFHQISAMLEDELL